jgi:hypothetical protein
MRYRPVRHLMASIPHAPLDPGKVRLIPNLGRVGPGLL